jgi:hypothetical protein
MNKVKLFAMAALAALAISVGGLMAAPSASAARSTCDRAMALAQAYIVIGDMLFNDGNYRAASYYYGYAHGLLDGAC